ncbi:uncharacterized protein TNCV_3232231 [Trichonephila clavipes]|nr:uncharacterized protein TNCV_3232231 [Trichonephila clavipes]
MLAHTRTLEYSVKEFLCDKGGEYDNRDVREILHSNGIAQRKITGILSKDVIFQEEAGKCDDHTELKLEDRVREDTTQGKYEEQLIKIEDNPIERPQSQEDLNDSVTDSEDAETTSDRQLRNRSLMQKPKRSLENTSAEDIVGVRVFRYNAASSVGYGITYHATETKCVLHCYSDSYFGGCTKTSRSNSGYVMIYDGGSISHGPAKGKLLLPLQRLKLFIAASEAAKEVIWLCRLIQDIVNLREIPIIQVDNKAAVKLSHNSKYHRTKHIEKKRFNAG